MLAIVEVEHRASPLCGHENVARKIMENPHLHVGGLGRITNVDGIKEQARP